MPFQTYCDRRCSMQMIYIKTKWVLVFLLGIATLSTSRTSFAQAVTYDDQIVFGVKIRAGGRYDNVRMCVGSPPGAKGGPAMDISFFTEVGISEDMSISFNLPVMRPILFGAAFKMLQLEPEVTLLFRHQREGKVDMIAGPSLGITLHYGPDFKSAQSGEERRPSFFALGPRIGGYFGLDFKRPDETFNFQLGLSPYITPLFSVNDADDHRGVVIGGVLDGQFRFAAR